MHDSRTSNGTVAQDSKATDWIAVHGSRISDKTNFVPLMRQSCMTEGTFVPDSHASNGTVVRVHESRTHSQASDGTVVYDSRVLT